LRAAHALTPNQHAVLRAIARCRTAALGGHVDVCSECGHVAPSYNSCRDRHCPKCQALAQARWVEQRMARLLPVHCFHVVFTLPKQLRDLVLANRETMFNVLLGVSASALKQLARDPKHLGGDVGITSVLHTWTRELLFHPHAHCIVTGGGLSLDGERWIATRPDFLLPVRALGTLFRGKFLDKVSDLYDAGKLRTDGPAARFADRRVFERVRAHLYKIRWVVYAKPPFGGPDEVFRYLGRYTHRVGISNARLLAFDERGVTFRTRGENTATLAPVEFLRRFVQHVLPKGFTKIRHYGLFAPSNVDAKLATARRLLACATPVAPRSPAPMGTRELLLALTGIDIERCARCGARALVRQPLPAPETSVNARAPPGQAA
jgi:Zn ribbon nucleic-acid-binding protein